MVTIEEKASVVDAESALADQDKTGALVGRLFDAALGAVDMVAVYIGDRLGLYRTLPPCPSNRRRRPAP